MAQGLPAYGKVKVAIPLIGALISVYGFALSTQPKYKAVGGLLIATGGLFTGITSAMVVYSRVQEEENKKRAMQALP